MKFYLILTVFSSSVFAKEIQTNSVYMLNAPDWLTRVRVEKVVDRIQTALEWSIRKTQVIWYTDENEFAKAHGMGTALRALARKNDNTVHLGPEINTENFDSVFGHELSHIISYQKYKDAIPRWLEEGLANYLSKNGKVDYKKLAGKPFPKDVRDLTHPLNGSREDILYKYQASHALAEMIAKKCDLTNLLRLSVGRKMEDYLKTYCEIPDLNVAFRKWVEQKSK